VHVAFNGTLTAQTAPLAYAALRKCLVEQPVAVLIDVGDLHCRSNVVVPLFLVMRREARRQPPVPLLVVAARTSSGSALRSALARYLPTCVSMEEARDMVARLPNAGRWRHFRFAPIPLAPSTAREAVTRCCTDWRLYALIHPVRTVVSELVSNAVEHAATDVEVTVAVRGHFLCLAVRDGSPVTPQLRDPAPHDRGAPLDIRGYGLRVVTNLAHTWGSEITPEGKVVWATLAITQRERRSRGTVGP